MMSTIRIESNWGDILVATNIDGETVGKAIVNFDSPLRLYCSNHLDADEKKWFDQINHYLSNQLCKVVSPLLKSVYAGDWEYQEDEYAFFTQRYPDLATQITDTQFRNTVKEIRNKWTSIEEVMSGVEKLIQSFHNLQLEATSWYEPGFTIEEFDSLYKTLDMLVRRKAKNVRIKIE